MSFEHPNRNNESMIDVERDIMSRPSERNTTNLDLQRMKMILDIMGHPEQSFRVIHITGTNGKGSTARMAESICRAYGMRTGLYTSPHLEHVNERIAIDGQQLSDDDFVDTWDQVKDLAVLAPLHNGPEAKGAEVMRALLPELGDVKTPMLCSFYSGYGAIADRLNEIAKEKKT